VVPAPATTLRLVGVAVRLKSGGAVPHDRQGHVGQDHDQQKAAELPVPDQQPVRPDGALEPAHSTHEEDLEEQREAADKA
jgi:hypothetical protein